MRFLLVVVLLALIGAAPARANDAKIVSQRSLGGRGTELTISTPAFAAPVKVQVFLPTGYDADPSKRWPVTYYLGGTNHDETTFKSYGGEKLTADYPSIIVGPSGNAGYWSDWYNGGAGGAPKYETYVIDQLIPLIDATYRTLGDRQHRAIFGESMGGYGVMMMAARHPDLFVAASSLSGAVDSNLHPNQEVLSASPALQGGLPDAIYGPRAAQEVRWRGHNPVDLVGNLHDLNLQLFGALGIVDPRIGEGPTDASGCQIEQLVNNATLSFDKALTGAHIAHRLVQYPTGCHSVPNFAREIAASIPVFADVFAHPVADPTTFSYSSIEPQFDVWGWHVQADPKRALEFLRLDDAGRAGVTVTGSGTTTVTTAPYFAGLKAVDVADQPVAPDSAGRLTFPVDLGAPDAQQQFTSGATTKTTKVSVVFKPHAIAKLTKFSRTRVCAKAIGADVPAARIRIGAHKTVHLRLTAGKTRCRKLHLKRGPYTAKLRGKDRFGHPVSATRKAR